LSSSGWRGGDLAFVEFENINAQQEYESFQMTTLLHPLYPWVILLFARPLLSYDFWELTRSYV
jgi:hypothetical protein